MKLRALLFVPLFLLQLFPLAAQAQTIAKPICQLQASSGVVRPGQTVNLAWKSQYATAGSITSIGSVGTEGIQGVIPVAPATTYTGTFTGPGGTGTCKVTVSVDSSYSGGGGTGGGFNDQTMTPAPTLPSGSGIQLSNNPGQGLVPCNGTDCQACHVVKLGQNIINFLLGLSIPLAAALFAYAGILLFVSSGAPDKIKKAKSIFKSVGIGFMIVVASWLAIQTVLKTILNPSMYQSWNEITCVNEDDRMLNTKFSDLISSLPGLNRQPVVVNGASNYGGYQTGYEGAFGCAPGYTVVGDECRSVENPSLPGTPVSTFDNPRTCFGNDAYSGNNLCAGDEGYYPAYAKSNTSSGAGGTCPSGYNYTEDAYQYWCQGPGGADDWEEVRDRPAAAASTAKGVAQWETQLYAACERSGLSDCAVAQAIMTHESAGRQNATSPAGAGGLMQLLPTTACGMDSSIDGCGTCRTRADNTNGNCGAVLQTLRNDPDLNMTLGTRELSRLYNKYNGDVSLVAAAYNGGDKANFASRSCGGMTQWQCQLNPGYQETRNYVPRVVGTYNKLR